MRLHRNIIRRSEDGICVDGTHGKVLLRPTPEGIKARYSAGPLVNGTAADYAERIKVAAIKTALSARLPWRTHRDGSLRITDHAAFYEQNFCPQIECLETLQRWLHATESL